MNEVFVVFYTHEFAEPEVLSIHKTQAGAIVKMAEYIEEVGYASNYYIESFKLEE